MKSKHLLNFCVILFCFLLIPIVCSAEFQKQFVDKEYGYSINHPFFWTASIYRSGDVLANIDSNDGKSGLQVRIIKSSSSKNSFVSDYINKFNRQMQADLISKRQMTIGYSSGYAVSFRAKRRGKDYFLKSYIIPTKSGFYVLQAGTPFNSKSQVELIFDSMAKSFR